MFRSTVEIVVALWCDERSSLPLQSRPIPAWFHLSGTAGSTVQFTPKPHFADQFVD